MSKEKPVINPSLFTWRRKTPKVTPYLVLQHDATLLVISNGILYAAIQVGLTGDWLVMS
jgi:hypothetical protein